MRGVCGFWVKRALTSALAILLVFLAASGASAQHTHQQERLASVDPGQLPYDVAPFLPNAPSVIPRKQQDRGTTGARKSFVLVLGGDLGLGGSGQRVSAKGGRRHGKLLPYNEMTRGLRPLINGDLNFANLETVVSAKTTLTPLPKAFNFQSHPKGIRHLVDIGFNVLSTANNHIVDYDQRGIRETLSNLDALRVRGLLAYPGVGYGREQARAPSILRLRGRSFAISAIGIGGGNLPNRSPSTSRPKQAGKLDYHDPGSFAETLAYLADADAAYRILSVHYGAERAVRPEPSALIKLRDLAVRDVGIDLVIGHHAHVARGVQRVGNKLIFYGLGNLLHPGMQDMARFSACRDYGVIARVHLIETDRRKLEARAVEVIPITKMHVSAQPMSLANAHKRIDILNYLAENLDGPADNTKGLRFTRQPNGRGLYCTANAHQEPGPIGQLCANWTPAPALSQAARRTARSACVPPVRMVTSSKSKLKTSARTGKSNGFGTPWQRTKLKSWEGHSRQNVFALQ